MHTVAGIDASTLSTGVSIMTDGRLIDYILLKLPKSMDIMQRIPSMLAKIGDYLNQYNIDEVYMEKAFKSQNIKTTMQLANLAGGMMYYCAEHGIEFIHPEPSVWRKAIGLSQGRGIKRETLKAEAVLAVNREYGIDVNDDVAESILLARSAFELPKLSITEDDVWE